MNRRKRRILKRCIALLFVTVFVALMLLLFTSGSHQPEAKTEYTYTVQKGDTLYSIAEDLEIEDWRKFAFETCKNNGLEQGGLIFTGQELVICY